MKEGRINSVLEELRDIKVVWAALKSISDDLDTVLDTNWSTVQVNFISTNINVHFSHLHGIRSHAKLEAL